MILIKIGGGKDINLDYIAEDISALSSRGEEIIVVHGANALMQEISKKLGNKEKIITSPSGHTSRYTNRVTMDILSMVYSGLANKKLVAFLQRRGVNAIGLTGADGRLWLGERKKIIYSQEGQKIKLITDSLTGNVTHVNTKLLHYLLRERYVPVITIPAITETGELINVDNDRAIAVMVKELAVTTIVFLFEAPGLLRSAVDETSLVKRIRQNSLKKYIEQTHGRMRKKLLGVQEAFSFGVKNVYFGDGRIAHPILNALKGKGTVIS